MNKTVNTMALATTAQSLAITSQLLAIGIELAIIGAGYYFYRKIKAETGPKEPDVVLVPEGIKLITSEKKTSLKEKFNKAKKIFMAVVS